MKSLEPNQNVSNESVHLRDAIQPCCACINTENVQDIVEAIKFRCENVARLDLKRRVVLAEPHVVEAVGREVVVVERTPDSYYSQGQTRTGSNEE